MKTKPTIVFVHGLWADGSSWSKVINPLVDKGYKVISVQNPTTSLEDDVATTKRAIDRADGDATLAEAQDLWKAVDRPNLLVKIPATEEGLAAIPPTPPEIRDAARALFNGDWADSAITIGVSLMAALAVFSVWTASRAFARATASSLERTLATRSASLGIV